MTHDLTGYTINIDSDHILVRHMGDLTVRAIEASRREAAGLATARHLKHFLVDVSQSISSLVTSEIFEVCAGHPSVLPCGATIAIVIRPGQFSADDAHFAETVSWNRGITLRTFLDCRAARCWLSA
jgi:hypothetical protein